MAVAPHYEWWVGDLRTGKLIRQVDLTGGTWSTDIAGVGTMGGSFPLRSMEWPDVASDTASPKSFLAVAYVDKNGVETFLEAGPLTPGEFADDAQGNLSVSGAGLSAYYGRRKLLPPLTPGQSPAGIVLHFEGKELGLIQKRLVELAHMHLGGEMPVVLPTDAELGGAGNDHIRNYPGHELGWIGERIKQLSEVIDGPEYQFVPRRRTDDPRYLEWVMRIGTAATGYLITQSGQPWVFDRSVPNSPVAGIKVGNDSSRKTYRSFAAGNGDAENRVIGWSENLTEVLDLGYALVESEVSSTDNVECLSTLIRHTQADLTENARSFDIWTVTVDRDADPNVGLYRPGDWCRVRVRDHYYISDGEHDRRIISMSGGGTSQFVELQMAPVWSEAGEDVAGTGAYGPDGYQFPDPVLTGGYGDGLYGAGPYGG